jgi:ATP-dependent Clp protease ATP-binding subunit ClpC
VFGRAPGVGKTAIVEGFASDVLDGSLKGLKYEMVIEITSGSLLGGTALRGELGEKVVSLVQEVQKAQGRIVLFIDDVHTVFSSSEFQEAAMELKKAISLGDIPCIFATTDCGFDRCMNDPSVLRFLSVVEVAEPSEDETKEILFGVAPEYESFHGVGIEDEALKAAVTLSKRYVADSFLPEKAVSIVDLAGAQVSRRGEKVVRTEDIASVLASRIGVPVERLVCTDSQRLLKIEESLAEDIIGHAHVLEALGETLRRNAVGFKSNRPIGSFLFLGSTGVGKTETAKSLSKLLFADENAIIRIDMSEYSEAHSIAKLIGAPPGYIGHEEGGQLTDAVRRRPYSLVLLDEIEKSNKDVILALLQVLDDGRLTDGRGRTVDFF